MLGLPKLFISPFLPILTISAKQTNRIFGDFKRVTEYKLINEVHLLSSMFSVNSVAEWMHHLKFNMNDRQQDFISETKPNKLVHHQVTLDILFNFSKVFLENESTLINYFLPNIYIYSSVNFNTKNWVYKIHTCCGPQTDYTTYINAIKKVTG